MTPLALRQAGPAQPQLAQWRAVWQRGAVVSGPVGAASGHQYLRFSVLTGTGRWQGLVDANQWLACNVPQLPKLLPQALHAPAALALFQAAPQPLDLAGSGLDWYTPEDVQAVEGSTWVTSCLACLALPEGLLWLLELPAFPPCTQAIPAWVRTLGLPLRLVLGRSAMPITTARRLGAGDLAVLRAPTFEAWLGHRQVGCFALGEQGFSLHHGPSILPSADEPTAKEPETMDHPEDRCLEPAPETMTLDVQFVLHTRRMSLAELAAMDDGQVLPLPDGGQHNVQLWVADKIIARGELVQLEGCLGVELHSVGEAPGDE